MEGPHDVDLIGGSFDPGPGATARFGEDANTSRIREVLIGGSSDPGAMARIREDEVTSRSDSDNLEVASGDGQEHSKTKPCKRNKYHRHTPYQIQELEA